MTESPRPDLLPADVDGSEAAPTAGRPVTDGVPAVPGDGGPAGIGDTSTVITGPGPVPAAPAPTGVPSPTPVGPAPGPVAPAPTGVPGGVETPSPAHPQPPAPPVPWWRRVLSGVRSGPGALAVAAVLILAGGFVANTAQTNGGTVRITPVSFPTSTGQMMTGLLYVPATATAKTPAPGVVTIEGYINTVDTMDGFAIEMARRGAVVLDANQTGQGGSAMVTGADAYGGGDALAYLNSLPMVRHDDVGLIGHSMGGWASVVAAFTNPTGYRSVALISSSVSTPTYEPVPGSPTFPRNVAVIEAKDSEFSQLMWAVPKGTEIPQSKRLEQLFGTTSPVVAGRTYGSVAKGTGRVLYLDDAIHPGMTFDPTAIQQAVAWMQRTLVGVGARPASDQIWLWDEIGTFLGLVGVVVLAFGVGATLLRTRFFRSVARPAPENRSLRGLPWWAGALLVALTGALSFFWFQTYGANQFPAGAIFPESITSGVATWAVGDALVAVVLFGLWHLTATRHHRRVPAPVPASPDVQLGNGSVAATGATPSTAVNGAAPATVDGAVTPTGTVAPGAKSPTSGFQRRAFASYGIAEPDGRVVDWANVGKSFLLAVASVVAVYAGVLLFEWAWSSDVRIWVFNIRPVTPMYLPVFLSYVGPFLLYFLAVSTVLFGQLRPRVSSLPRFMAIVTSILVVGFVGLIGVEYGTLWATGELATSSQPLLAIVAFQFVPIFVIVGTLLSYFFWRTGRIWTGAFVCTLLITAVLVTGTAMQGVPW